MKPAYAMQWQRKAEYIGLFIFVQNYLVFFYFLQIGLLPGGGRCHGPHPGGRDTPPRPYSDVLFWTNYCLENHSDLGKIYGYPTLFKVQQHVFFICLLQLYTGSIENAILLAAREISESPQKIA